MKIETPQEYHLYFEEEELKHLREAAETLRAICESMDDRECEALAVGLSCYEEYVSLDKLEDAASILLRFNPSYSYRML